MNRSVFSAVASALALLLASSACASPAEEPVESRVLTIGICQIAKHPSLDYAREGFKDAFLAAGYVEGENVVFSQHNADNDPAAAARIAETFVADEVDLILAVATPSAQAASKATNRIPIVFTAVTDPVNAHIVASKERPGGNITGTSDLSPIDKDAQLIKELNPAAKTVGVIYNANESNSVSQLAMFTAAATPLGLEVVTAEVSGAEQLAEKTESLAAVDAIFVLSDNTIAAGLETVLTVATSHSIPVIASDGEGVERGAIASYGVDYRALGAQAAEMALSILRDGKSPSSIPVRTAETAELSVNPDAAKRIGLTIPRDLLVRAVTIY